MKKVLYFSFLLLFAKSNFAQTNLVVNPSFEDYNNCPGGFSSIVATTEANYPSLVYPSVEYWIRGTNDGSPDYFNSCAMNNNIKTPLNYFGKAEPRTGDAYAGGSCLSVELSHVEYLQTKLSAPLVAGHTYFISFYVQLASGSGTMMRNTNISGIDNMGVELSDKFSSPTDMIRTFSGDGFINPAGQYLADTANWMLVSGTYEAKGNEEWIVIGAFERKDPSSKPADTLVWNGNFSTTRSYYYFEDVCVIDLDSAAATVTEALISCIKDTLTLENPNSEKGNVYHWNTGETSATIDITEEGKYWVRTIGECEAFIDTFIVSYNTVSSKPSISVNEKVLSTSDEYATYQWLKEGIAIANATEHTYTVTENGDYAVAVSDTAGCVDTSDAYTVNNATSLQGLNLKDIVTVYPNPAKETLFIESPVAVQYYITSIEGKRYTQVSLFHTAIDMTNLPSGVYLIHVLDMEGVGIKVEKIIKQ